MLHLLSHRDGALTTGQCVTSYSSRVVQVQPHMSERGTSVVCVGVSVFERRPSLRDIRGEVRVRETGRDWALTFPA